MLSIVRIIPRPIRDWAYDVFARNRYRWFGRLKACMVPTPELAARFILE
jgi:predicted DCC family thiol-disulfide oxidoreductase YuxK